MIHRCYLAYCDGKNITPDDQVPEAFDYQSFQKNKFVLAYKQIGPPREKFHPGTKCDEEFANPSQVSDRGTGTKKRKASGLSRDRVREANAKKHKEALAEAVVERRQVEAVSQEQRMYQIGKSHATQKFLRSHASQEHKHTQLMMEFFKLTSNPDMKRRLEQQLMDRMMAPPMTYAKAEEVMYGSSASNPVVIDDDIVTTPELRMSTPVTGGTGSVSAVRSSHASRARRAVNLAPASAASDDENTGAEEEEDHDVADNMDDIEVMQARSIMKDIIMRSGYVVIHNVIPRVPDQDEWFSKLKADVLKLKGTNNMVPIFNGRGSRNDKKRHQLLFNPEFDARAVYPGMPRRPASDPAVLGRVNAFLEGWWVYIRKKLEALKIITGYRKTGDPHLLMSLEGCKVQKMHWDYPAAKVQALIEDGQYEDVPVSVLTSFTPGGSAIMIKDGPRKSKKVDLPFGSMVVFTGDVLHAGAGYKDFNLRGFMHVENKDVLAFKTDQVYHQLDPQVAPSDRQTRSASLRNENASLEV